VVDAAGVIYVLGGYSQNFSTGSSIDTWYHDMWASTDGGARHGGCHEVL
jgi:hypothetical protein